MPKLLLVEDTRDDEMLFLRAIEKMETQMDVEVVRDGEAAVNRLCKAGSKAGQPDLVVLDWKLPKMMGAEVLAKVRNTNQCRGLKVVGFSSSDSHDDREEFRRLGGDAYVSKPIGYEEFVTTVQQIVRTHLPSQLLMPAG